MIWCVTDSNEAEGLAGYSPLKTLLHVLSQPRGVIFVCYPAGSSPLYTHHDIQMMWEQIGKEKKA